MSDINEDLLQNQLTKIGYSEIDAPAIVDNMQRSELEINKYDRFIPEFLLKEAMLTDNLDIAGTVSFLHNL